ncbi:MoxR family ATPase [Oxalobacter sp. OttesenSCG-928-P03]|nr:MoxR family ATPase [Oxalobacter sp. OttesenSCG-928-P03]
MSKIKCEICGADTHAIEVHIKRDHPEVTLDEYVAKYPDAPLLSEMAKQKLKEQQELKERTAKAARPVTETAHDKKPMHEVFGLGKVAGAMNAAGQPYLVSVTTSEYEDMVPDLDLDYVFELEGLKNVLMAIEMNIPAYVWGHAGTGKTTLIEQVAARTKRPLLRVQHTVNTEEAHVVGQWTARAGETIFELGPLALAMKHGWIYLADEYDFALPAVLAVYQPVLEGKSLVIKEADSLNRIIRPHPNFRFIATGNTNGSGDETSLYQGTSIQNAANYDRFHMVLEMKYMEPELEKQVLINQAKIDKGDAERFVEFANRVREQFSGSKISSPISPRTLIAAATIGYIKGNFRTGLALAWANKLPRMDREVVDGLAQRIFG